jgi:RNA polymerase sigma factor (TIGR02999 family)
MDGAKPEEAVTELLASWRQGNADAVNTLFSLLYRELQIMARRHRRASSAGETMRTTVLVHEAYLKLVDHAKMDIQDRHHFFSLASRVMRQVIVDATRRREAAKRGSGATHIALDDVADGSGPLIDVLALDEALDRLSAMDARLCQIVELRLFSGLTVEETAELLGASPRTIKRDWRKARAFLFAELRAPGDESREPESQS